MIPCCTAPGFCRNNTSPEGIGGKNSGEAKAEKRRRLRLFSGKAKPPMGCRDVPGRTTLQAPPGRKV